MVDMTDYPSDFDTGDSPQSPDWEAIARHVAGEDTPESTVRLDALLSEASERDLIASIQESDRFFARSHESDARWYPNGYRRREGSPKRQGTDEGRRSTVTQG